MSDLSTENRLLVGAVQAAAMMGCGRSTFWQRVRSGAYPAPVKDCGSTRWRVADLQQHVQAMPTTRPSDFDAEEGTQHGCMRP
jgi:predicted DNA-binding transcriptional regulator AlpA